VNTVILVAREEAKELEALLEAALGDQAEVRLFPSLQDLFPAVMKSDPNLLFIDGRAVAQGEAGLIAVLKRTFPSLRIVLSVRLEERKKATEALGSGADGYIVEPFYFAEFVRFLRKEFALSRGRDKEALDGKMDVLASFVAGFAPEINNPLTTIRGFLQILMTEDAFKMDPGEIDEILGLMEKESRRISRIVAELENFARMRKPKRLPVSLPSLCERAAEEARKESGLDIPIRLDLAACPLEGMVDEKQILDSLKSFFFFLLAGADRDRGKVTLTAAENIPRSRLIITIEGENTVSLKKEAEMAFIPLYARKLVGLKEELGMASAYAAVRAHGGTVAVSPLKEGTRFVIELPCDQPREG